MSSAEKAAEDVIFQGFAKARRAMRFEQNHDLSTLSTKKGPQWVGSLRNNQYSFLSTSSNT